MDPPPPPRARDPLPQVWLDALNRGTTHEETEKFSPDNLRKPVGRFQQQPQFDNNNNRYGNVEPSAYISPGLYKAQSTYNYNQASPAVGSYSVFGDPTLTNAYETSSGYGSNAYGTRTLETSGYETSGYGYGSPAHETSGYEKPTFGTSGYDNEETFGYVSNAYETPTYGTNSFETQPTYGTNSFETPNYGRNGYETSGSRRNAYFGSGLEFAAYQRQLVRDRILAYLVPGLYGPPRLPRLPRDSLID